MAESVLFDIATEILKLAASNIFSEIQLVRGARDELDTLKDTLKSIQTVLVDDEEQGHKKQDKLWLGRLKDVLYDARDLLDDVATEDLRRKVMPGDKMSKAVRVFFSKSNQLVYRHKVGNEIKKLGERLDKIAKNKKRYELKPHLIEEIMAAARGKILKIPTPEEQIFTTYEQIIGREDDKKYIKQLLLDPTSGDTVSIVGKGGLGKTALAKLVYEDGEARRYFDLQMWVLVSSDVFDWNLTIKKMLESVHYQDHESDRLHETLREKKYLLVLDDMWNEDLDKWLLLGNWLRGGKQGSKILVTTRSDKVAEFTNNNFVNHYLECLTTDESWDLFKEIVFGKRQASEVERWESWEEMGRDIVGKCAGVPLAIRTIGSLMHGLDKNQWKYYIDKELSEIPKHDGIMQVLKSSYDHLPSCLKLCFVYCSLFPKNYIYHKETMMPLWAAQGFIKESQNELPLWAAQSSQSLGGDLEQVTNNYLSVLTHRSFINAVGKDKYGEVLAFTMHDLMHDLAQEVAEGECKIFKERDNDERIRHLSFISKIFSEEKMPSLIKTSKLRTLLYWKGEPSILNSRKVFSECKHCRVLGLCEMDIPFPHSSFGKLKQLRSLYISKNQSIEIFPDSITELVNLQFLKLFGCTNLKRFPRDLRKLVNLRDLSIHKCDSLSRLPPLSGLPSLRTLSLIYLDALEFIQPEQSNTIHLFFPSLENLVLFKCDSLIGWWGRRQVMKAYQKHQSNNSQSSFPKLRSVEISECPNLIFVPPFPQVECLKIDSMKMLEEHVSKPAVGSTFFHFSKLKHLHLLDRDLEPSILETLLLSASNLESIKLDGRSQLLRRVGMNDLFLHRKPIIRRCEGLNLLYQEDDQGTERQFLAELRILQISYIPDWVTLPEWIRRVTTLQSLEIYECENLESLPEWIGNFSSLEKLILCVCPKLKDLPSMITIRKFFRPFELKIINCPDLEGNCQMDLDFPVISPEGI